MGSLTFKSESLTAQSLQDGTPLSLKCQVLTSGSFDSDTTIPQGADCTSSKFMEFL